MKRFNHIMWTKNNCRQFWSLWNLFIFIKFPWKKELFKLYGPFLWMAVYFLPLSPQKFLVLTLSVENGRNIETSWESCFFTKFPPCTPSLSIYLSTTEFYFTQFHYVIGMSTLHLPGSENFPWIKKLMFGLNWCLD